MKLNILSRTAEKKCEAKRLRREGKIPAVVYERGAPGKTIAIDRTEFGAILRKMESGRLPTTIFELVDESGKPMRAIVKDIQYNITNYDVNHIDFEELVEDLKVNVKVPIECTGMADSSGIKLGGVLRQVIRFIRVRCFPRDIPTVFRLDVSSLGPRQSKRLKDIEMPADVRPLADLKEVVAVIVKR
jgi:large subunit ribosomal protein L25